MSELVNKQVDERNERAAKRRKRENDNSNLEQQLENARAQIANYERKCTALESENAALKSENEAYKRKYSEEPDEITIMVLVQLISIMVQNGPFNASNSTLAFLHRYVPTNIRNSFQPIPIPCGHPVLKAFRQVFNKNPKRTSKFDRRMDAIFSGHQPKTHRPKTHSVLLGNTVASFSEKSISFRHLTGKDVHQKGGENAYFGQKCLFPADCNCQNIIL